VRVLLASGINPGHVVPYLGLAEELAARGHEVTFYADAAALPLTRGIRAATIAAARVGSFEVRSRTIAEQTNGAREVARRTARHLLKTLARHRFDAIVVDHMHLGAALAAEKSGLPWGSLSTSPVLMSPSFNAWPTCIPTAALRRELALPSTSIDSLRQGMSPHLHLLTWSPELDLAPAPAQAVHVGPLARTVRAAPRGLVPRGRGPVVLVSVSTSPHRSLREGLHRFLRTVADFLVAHRIRAVLTLGNVKLALPRAPSLRVVPFADHAAVMEEASLVVTHGGWGTIGHALLAGVPMLIAPFERDQFANAQLCAQRGVAIPCDHQRVDEGALEEMFAALLAARSPFARQARQVRQELRRLRPRATAASAVLALGRTRTPSSDPGVRASSRSSPRR
jgi:UDP:flavonoid glycosyltransferase YjiC (YdhE family)